MTSVSIASDFSPPLRAMIVDDESMTLAMLGRVLEKDHWEVFPASNLREASAILSNTVPDVAIVDVYLGEDDGLAYARELRSKMPDLGIIVISSDDTDTLANQAIQSGADGFLSKPIPPSALTLTARKQAELRRERQRAVELKRELSRAARDSVFPKIVTHSDTMKAALRLVEKVAPRDLSALICGESGTGKELVARAIHEISARATGEFVEVNCGALPPNLVESELFGHEKGAFTGAIASRVGKIEQASGGHALSGRDRRASPGNSAEASARSPREARDAPGRPPDH
jgi:two-component system nitrogen regulation response regulator NtrX